MPARARAKPAGLRREILDAALELIAARGVEALSIRELARRAGVTHQAPYHHFQDRAAILAALAQEGFGLMRDALVAAVAAAPAGADARFEACGLGYVQFAIEHKAYFRVMFRPESHTPRRAEVRRASLEAMQVLIDVVVAAQAAGVAPAGDPMPLVLTSWSTAHGVAALLVDGMFARSFGLGSRNADAVGALIARTLTDLLKVGAGRPKR